MRYCKCKWAEPKHEANVRQFDVVMMGFSTIWLHHCFVCPHPAWGMLRHQLQLLFSVFPAISPTSRLQVLKVECLTWLLVLLPATILTDFSPAKLHVSQFYNFSELDHRIGEIKYRQLRKLNSNRSRWIESGLG